MQQTRWSIQGCRCLQRAYPSRWGRGAPASVSAPALPLQAASGADALDLAAEGATRAAGLVRGRSDARVGLPGGGGPRAGQPRAGAAAVRVGTRAGPGAQVAGLREAAEVALGSVVLGGSKQLSHLLSPEGGRASTRGRCGVCTKRWSSSFASSASAGGVRWARGPRPCPAPPNPRRACLRDPAP